MDEKGNNSMKTSCDDRVDHKLIPIIDMACNSGQNIHEKVNKKLQKYQQLAYKIREWRSVYHVEIISLIIGCMGRGANKLRHQIARVLEADKK